MANIPGNQPIPFLPGPDWNNPLHDLPPPDPDWGPVNANPQDQLQAGARPVGRNAVPDDNGVINLDKNHGNEEPSKAVLNAVAAKLGCTVEELKNKNFRLEKGFRPEKGSDKPIPVHAYSNPPGPDSYYFVRHWHVTVQDDQGQDVKMHFSKKIFTSVEVPRSLDGTVQKQQQYIAALAARTYAKIEESRMIVGAGGQSDLYNSIESHISKIAKDRFVTMEMFNNAKNVAVNPSKEKKIKDVTVDNIRLHFRSGHAGVEGEADEGFKVISLTPNDSPRKAQKLKEKIYQFEVDNAPSPHVRKVSNLLKAEDILHNIRENQMTPEDAFAEAGVTKEEIKEMKHGEIKGTVLKFYRQMNYFGDSKSVKNLMANHAPNQYQISDDLMQNITKKPSRMDRIKNRIGIDSAPPKDLTALKGLRDFVENKNPGANQKIEARMMLEAAKDVYKIMLEEHEAVKNIQTDLKDMGLPLSISPDAERQAILDEMKNHIDFLEEALPEVPQQVGNANGNQNARDTISFDDSNDHLNDLDE